MYQEIRDLSMKFKPIYNICAGDTLTAVSQLSNLEVKDSKSLGKMLIIKTETTYKNDNDKLVAIQRGQAIFY